jgi:hypothetical protein
LITRVDERKRPRLSLAAAAAAIAAVAGAISAVVALLPHDDKPTPQPVITNVIRLTPQQRRQADKVRSDDWPGGRGFTAILASRPTEIDARSVQRDASGRGLDAGILRSDNFRSLNPGYWVVFSGTFPTNSDAAKRAARAQELGFADAYPRFVSP